MRLDIAVDNVLQKPINLGNGDTLLITSTGSAINSVLTSNDVQAILKTVRLMSEAPSFKLAKRIARQRGHLA